MVLPSELLMCSVHELWVLKALRCCDDDDLVCCVLTVDVMVTA